MTPRQRVIMPVDGFLHAYGTMSALVDQLAKSGAIKRTGEQPAATARLPRRNRRARPTSASRDAGRAIRPATWDGSRSRRPG